MGFDIDLHYGKYKNIVKMFAKAGCSDIKFVKKAMDLFGIHAGDLFIILHNNYHSNNNMMTGLCHYLEQYFKLSKDADLFSDLLDITNEKEYPKLDEEN